MRENTIFTQLMKLISPMNRESIFNKHNNNRYVKKFSGWQHFVVLFVSQIKGLSSLRDICTTFTSHTSKLYHMGLIKVRRSTLSDANNKRKPDAFKELFSHVLSRCYRVAPKHRFRFKNKFYSMDSSTISLCLSLFLWAKFRSRKGGVKLHTLFNNSGYLPDFIRITPASKHDATQSKIVCKRLSEGSIVTFDKGYINFDWFYELTLSKIFFITRAKSNLCYRILKRNPKNRQKGILLDHIIELRGYYKKQEYPAQLRLIKYRNQTDGKVYTYLTNHFSLSASTIAECYKERWQIELFFKWIKQNLRIKIFYGTSENAVLIQIWTAMIYYLIIAYVKYLNKCKLSMLTITRIIKEQLFEKKLLTDILNLKSKPKIPDESIQL